eukprot:7218374-Pyramimonas_sp.AAC.1
MLGYTTGGRSTSVVMLLHYFGRDPKAVGLRRQVAEWIKRWKRWPDYHDKLRGGWHAAVQRLQRARPRGRWNVVTGPMAALIQGLSELGWQLPEPDTWTDAQENEWTMAQQPHQHNMYASRELPPSDGSQDGQ